MSAETETTAPSEVTRWRKKPIVVEARRVQTHNLAEVAAWCNGVAYTEDTPWNHSAGAVVMPDGHYAHVRYRDWGVIVPTLEGDMLARYGWWVIKGVKGEFYPCDPEILAATYESAEASADTTPVTRGELAAAALAAERARETIAMLGEDLIRQRKRAERAEEKLAGIRKRAESALDAVQRQPLAHGSGDAALSAMEILAIIGGETTGSPS